MIIVADSFSGLQNQDVTAHVPELGGVPIAHPITGPNPNRLSGLNTARTNAAGSTVLYYPTLPPVADYAINFTLHPVSYTDTTLLGVVARASATASTMVIVRYEPPANRFGIYELVGGAVVSTQFYAYVLTNGADVAVRVEFEGSNLSLYLNGVFAAPAAIANVTANGYAGIEFGALTGPVGGLEIAAYSVATFSSAPATRVLALLQPSNVTAVYTPTDGTTEPNLTLWLAPRNLVIKGKQADLAWDWITHNTPPALIFGM